MSTPRPATYSYKTERHVLDTDAGQRAVYEALLDAEHLAKVQQVHCRGRWRAVKRKLQVLAAELGWPGCMEVAHADQIEGCVLRAGAKLSRWLSKHRRKPADRAAERAHRKTLRANPDYVPF